MSEAAEPDPALSMAECRAALGSLRYLLVSLVPFFRDAAGRVWLDPMWHRDLLAHTDYLSHLTVLAPEWHERPEDTDLQAVDAPAGVRLQFESSGPVPRSGGEALLAAPALLRAARRAVRHADVLHSGVAGWPFPPGAIVNPVALARGKPLIIVVESAFWRIPAGSGASFKQRTIARLTERFARWSLSHARLAVYTHPGYRASLPPGPDTTEAVIPASWISASDILDGAAARHAWDAKPQRPRFLFASRLVAQKGAALILAAVERLEREGAEVEIDVIGAGEMRPDFVAAAPRLRHVRMNVLDPLPYGAPFMTLLRGYHAVIVPTVGDEQPRILYDAFAQGVPAIASETPGNSATLTDRHAGTLFTAGDPGALAAALVAASNDPQALRRMGGAALEVARLHTHERMHLERARILARLFGVSPSATAPEAPR